MKVTQEQLDFLRNTGKQIDGEVSKGPLTLQTSEAINQLCNLLSVLCAEIIIENAVVTDNLKLNFKWPKDKEQSS